MAVTLTLFFSTANGTTSHVETFSLTTADAISTLNGEIEFPSYSGSKFPLVVMIPGTGLFDRDVDFGNGNTDKDLIFKTIAGELVKSGFAVLRYDYRGVKCNKRTMQQAPTDLDAKEKLLRFFDLCVDHAVRGSVTPENAREDINTIYRFGELNRRVDASRIIVFGHSEGSLNLSYLIGSGSIQPAGAVFMGGLAESLASVIRWQYIDRIVDTVFAMDSNHDEKVSNDEIRENHKASALNNAPIADLLSPTGFWLREDLHQVRVALYEKEKADALSKPDNMPFPSEKYVQGSYRWWKMFFQDETPVISLLKNFKKQVIYINGTRDAQTDFARQRRAIEQFASMFEIPPKIKRIKNTGHGLGSDPIFGPPTKRSVREIVRSIRAVSETNPDPKAK